MVTLVWGGGGGGFGGAPPPLGFNYSKEATGAGHRSERGAPLAPPGGPTLAPGGAGPPRPCPSSYRWPKAPPLGPGRRAGSAQSRAPAGNGPGTCGRGVPNSTPSPPPPAPQHHQPPPLCQPPVTAPQPLCNCPAPPPAQALPRRWPRAVCGPQPLCNCPAPPPAQAHPPALATCGLRPPTAESTIEGGGLVDRVDRSRRVAHAVPEVQTPDTERPLRPLSTGPQVFQGA